MTTPASTKQQKEQLTRKLVELLAAGMATLPPEQRTALLTAPPAVRNEQLLKNLPDEYKTAWQGLKPFEKTSAAQNAEREANVQAEQARIAEMAALLAPNELEWDGVPEGSDSFVFRAAGKGQEPWELFGVGFQHRSGVPSADAVKDYLRQFYHPDGEGADTIVQNYRITNTTKMGAPLISTGPEKGGRQGSSGAIWSYGIQMPALTEVTGDVIASTFGFAPNGLGKTKLLTDTGTIDGAQYVVFFGGGLGEYTWLTPIPSDWVVAFYRIQGQPWQQRWRPFDNTVINHYKTTVEAYGQTP